MATANPENLEKAQSAAKKATSNVAHLSEALANEMKESAEKAAEVVSKVSSDYLAQSRRAIQEHPLIAVATGFGVGILLGALLKRDR